jgi:hypothetical protein
MSAMGGKLTLANDVSLAYNPAFPQIEPTGYAYDGKRVVWA